MTIDLSNLDAVVPPLKMGLDAVQVEHEGQPIVVLRDQEGLSDKSMGLSMAGFMVAMLFNGKNSINEIQSQFSKSTGALITPDEIKKLATDLDQSDFLETVELGEKRRNMVRDYLASPVRKAMHLAVGPSENLLDLATKIGAYFRDSKGPGKPLAEKTSGHPPQGLVAPHIDFHRGGPAYAWAYQALSETPPPDLVVAIGVAHMSPPSPWVATKKSYETPYGEMKVDEGLYEDFKSSLWYDPANEELVHRTEHSLEFQAFWLRYVWREKTPAWLPILCSSFETWAQDKSPSTVSTVDEGINKFAAALKKRQDQGQKILILSGIDLAHVGPRFGDNIELNEETFKKIENEDQESLKKAMELDSDAFYMSVIKDDHWRKVCGLSAFYTSLRLMKALSAEPGRLLTYGQAPDPMGGVVSFASAVFPRKNGVS